jgi:1,4-dihydroxy-2-naphthoate octaprenyltransferase
VLLGCALAYSEGAFRCLPAVLCLLVALLAQVASNLANDYFDFKKGIDTGERLGPERAVSSGRITPRSMLTAALLTLGAACLCGLGLVYIAGWQLLFIGIAVAACVLAYSAGPFPLASNGLGDVCVLLFYGIIPVCFTCYVQAFTISRLAFFLSLSMGFLSVNILVVNNYRDYAQDRQTGKRTTIVRFGRTFGRIFYLTNGLLAMACAVPALIQTTLWLKLLFLLFLVPFLVSWRELTRFQGRALNKTLEHTARNVLLFALLLVLALLFR